MDLASIVAKYRRMFRDHKPILGRWTWCKYCGRNVRPVVSRCYSVILCDRCGYGLAPMREVCEAGSLAAWRGKIHAEFAAKAKTE